MSEFFKSCAIVYRNIKYEDFSFIVNWFTISYINPMKYMNCCALRKNCWNDTLNFGTHFDIIWEEDSVKIEFSDFLFYIRKSFLTELVSSNTNCNQDLKIVVRPHWITSGLPLKDDYEVFLNLTLVEKI